MASGQVAPPGGSLYKTLEDTEGHLAHATHNTRPAYYKHAQHLHSACLRRVPRPVSRRRPPAKPATHPSGRPRWPASEEPLRLHGCSVPRVQRNEVMASRSPPSASWKNWRICGADEFPRRGGSDADRPSRFWTQSSTLATSRSAGSSCLAAMEARLGRLRVCNVRTYALTKGSARFLPKTGSATI